MPNEKKAKAPVPQIVIGGLVRTSLAKVGKDDELLPYVVHDGLAKVDDLYVVMANNGLAFLRTTKVVDYYEFLPYKINYCGDLKDIRDVVCRVDIETYKKNRHIKYKRSELEECLDRIVDMISGNKEKGIDCGDLNDAADTVREKIELLENDPDAYLAKYEPKEDK